VTLGEAAWQLGVSIDTVRRRVKDGSLEARKEPSRRGPAWRVRLVPLPAGASPSGRSVSAADAEYAPPELTTVVAELQERVIELARQVGYLQAQLDEVQRRPPPEAEQERG